MTRKWIDQIDLHDRFYIKPTERASGKGFGSTEAARGALSDWIVLEDGKIANYQVITPTAWNIGPKDGKEANGPMEQSFIGAPVEDLHDPIELGHVARSFDSCIVCTVHAYDGKTGKEMARFKVDGMRVRSRLDVHLGRASRRVRLVIGCGNLLRGDDAVGPVLVRRLLDRGLPAGVEVADGGTCGHGRGVPHARRGRVWSSSTRRRAVAMPGTIYRLAGRRRGDAAAARGHQPPQPSAGTTRSRSRAGAQGRVPRRGLRLPDRGRRLRARCRR